jgi:hypothetical protein
MRLYSFALAYLRTTRQEVKVSLIFPVHMVLAFAVYFKRRLKKRTRSSNFSVLFLIVLFASILVMVEAESTANTTPHKQKPEILLVFSDLDGTLIHYPEEASNGNDGILKLPPSSTGMRGEISSKTLSLAQGIRKRGKMLILISGMRTTTLLDRLPFLPRADAYCSEAGGRIFYPTDDLGKGFSVKPKHYDGATEEDMTEFGLVEDMEWRQLMESHTGKFDLDDPFSSTATIVPQPMDTRDGVLWEFARFLTEVGYVLDTKGYSACFRVNKKQQTVLSADDFQALLDGRIVPFSGLGTSVNLNCIDVYPSISGKKNW